MRPKQVTKPKAKAKTASGRKQQPTTPKTSKEIRDMGRILQAPKRPVA